MTMVGELVALLRLDTSTVGGSAAAAKAHLASIGPTTAASARQATTAVDQLEREVKQLDRSTKAAAASASSLKQARSGILQGLGTGVGLAGGVGAAMLASQASSAAVGFMFDAINAASDLNETVSKSNVVFGESARMVESFGDRSAEAYGISKQAAIEAAASFGNVFVNVGILRSRAAEMSTSLVGLAGDLASFNNVSTDDALEKLRAGLAGEAEPLRSFGVFLNEGAVRAEAMRLGLADLHGELSDGAKVQARYSLILAGTKTAQGDAAKTGDELAGSARRLQAEIADLQAEIGQELLPIARDFTHWAADEGVPAVEGLVQAVKDAKPAFDALGFAFLAVRASIGQANIGYELALNQAKDEIKRLQGIRDALEEHRRGERESLRIEIPVEVAPTVQASSVSELYRQLKDQVADGSTTVADQVSKFVDMVGEDVGRLREVGRVGGAELMASTADGIEAHRQDVRDALSNLHVLVGQEMNKSRRIAYLLAALAGSDMAAGLNSSDPVVYNAAVRTRRLISDQLDALTEGAYSAGKNTIKNLLAGMEAGGGKTVAGLRAIARERKAMNEWKGDLTPSQILQGQRDYLDSIKDSATAARRSVSTLAGDARDKLKSSFDDVKRAARSFFDELHSRNLRAIGDARDLANAQLQGEVDRARTALDHKRDNEQLFQLQKALARAAPGEDREQAAIALADFQAELQLRAQQEQVDIQVAANNAKAAEEKKAEDKRYTEQVAAFNRELAALQRHLLRHPEEWRRVQRNVLGLLAKYGVDYIEAGATLGKKFVDGLRSSIADAQAAAAALAKAGTPRSGSGSAPAPGGKKPAYASGAWDLSSTQDALVHAREMILPDSTASEVRRLAGSMGNIVPMLQLARHGAGVRGQLPTFGTSPAMRQLGVMPAGISSGPGGGGTINVYVGSEKLVEIADRGLQVNHGIYNRPVIHSGSQR